MSFNDYLHESQQFNEGIVNLDRGYTLLKYECAIIGILVFIASLMNGGGVIQSLIIAAIIIAVIPQVLLRLKGLALIWISIFSLMWGFVGYVIGAALMGDNVLLELVVAIVVAFLSFVFHKASLGIGFKTLTALHFSNQEQIINNTRNSGNNDNSPDDYEDEPDEYDEEYEYEPDEYDEEPEDETEEYDYEEDTHKATKHCMYCGEVINDDALFCSRCGKRQ